MDLSKPEYRKVSANVARCCPLLARSLTYLFNDFGGRDRPALFETSSLLRRAREKEKKYKEKSAPRRLFFSFLFGSLAAIIPFGGCKRLLCSCTPTADIIFCLPSPEWGAPRKSRDHINQHFKSHRDCVKKQKEC